jgi:hypothetical protein
MERAPLRRVIALVLIVASVVVIAAIGALDYARVHSAVTLQKAQKVLERDIESHLPPGTALRSVEEFLNQRSMRHTDLERTDGALAIQYGSDDILGEKWGHGHRHLPSGTLFVLDHFPVRQEWDPSGV